MQNEIRLYERFKGDFNAISTLVHDNARSKGFWDHDEWVERLHDAIDALPIPEQAKLLAEDQLNDIHDTLYKGTRRNTGEMLALIHSEISEALEAVRKGNPPDDKIPQFSGLEAELADTVIRIMDLGAAQDLRIAEAIVAKMNYNRTRKRKHGKEF